MINCHLSSISHRFRDITSRTRSKTTPPKFEFPIKGTPFEFRHQAWQTQSYGIGLHFSENCMILALAVLLQYTRVPDKRQTDDRQRHFMAIMELAMQLQRTAKTVHKMSTLPKIFGHGY